MDLKETSELRREKGVDVLTLIRDPFHERMRRVRAPIIAAMTGHFAAGGFMLSLNADLRIDLAGTKRGNHGSEAGQGLTMGDAAPMAVAAAARNGVDPYGRIPAD